MDFGSLPVYSLSLSLSLRPPLFLSLNASILARKQQSSVSTPRPHLPAFHERNFVIEKLHRIFSLLTRDHRLAFSTLWHTNTTSIENFHGVPSSPSLPRLLLELLSPSGNWRCIRSRAKSRGLQPLFLRKPRFRWNFVFLWENGQRCVTHMLANVIRWYLFYAVQRSRTSPVGSFLETGTGWC